MTEISGFIPLTGPPLRWYKERIWAYITPGQVASCEPVWRIFAKVPEGYAFNYQIENPGWELQE